VALATCAEVAGREADDLRVIDALSRRGIAAVHTAWDDPAVDWSSFALVVVRSTWDYPQRRDAFLTWAEALPAVLNPAPILRWNTDKRYLDELAAAGLPVIPTRFLEPSAGFEPPPIPFVIKPAISCSAKDTARYDPGDPAAHEHVQQLQRHGRTVMVQPYLGGIEAEGEVAVAFIGGVYSHAIRRGALLKDGRPSWEGHSLPPDIEEYRATAAERALAERVLGQVPGGPAELLYARVDLVPGPDGAPQVLEVELTEPSLFLGYSHGGADRLADAIGSALARG
jgi:glutathione synthase/RimK-type ligase-like ATP-grasp enzyme